METDQPSANKGNKTVLFVVGGIILLCFCLAIVGVAAYITLAPAVQNVNEQVQEGIGYSGIADEQLRSDVLNAIADYETSQTGCTEISLFAGQLLVSPEQSGNGTWTETWQLAVCGESHLYSVVFTPSTAGGTDFSVSRLDQ